MNLSYRSAHSFFSTLRLSDLVRLQAQVRGNKKAWIVRSTADASSVLTWNEIASFVAAMAKRFSIRGWNRGDRIVTWNRNSLEWILIDLACAELDLIHVPLDRRLDSETARNIADEVDPAAVFTDDMVNCPIDRCENTPNIRDLSPAELPQSLRFHSSSIANILYTSGTSAAPKGVMLSHRNLILNALGKLDAMPQFPSDHRLTILPFSHAYARTCELTTWLISGGSMEIAPTVDLFWENAPWASPTLINLVPSLINAAQSRIGSPSDPESTTRFATVFGKNLRQLACGGAGLSDQTRQTFSQFGIPIHLGYGLTEASPVVCSNRASIADESPSQFCEIGPTIFNMECRLSSEGELLIRGDGVMCGYWQNAQATKERIQDGWLHSGDRAEWSADKSSWQITGRVDDVIVLSNGYKVFPNSIESAIQSMDHVEDCILIGNNTPQCKLIVRVLDTKVDLREPEVADAFRTRIDERLRALTRNQWWYRIEHIHLTSDSWDADSGLRNFKGGIKRKEIEKRYLHVQK